MQYIHTQKEIFSSVYVRLSLVSGCVKLWFTSGPSYHNWICPFRHMSWINGGITSHHESLTLFSVGMFSARWHISNPLIVLLLQWFANYIFWPCGLIVDLPLTDSVLFCSAIVPSVEYMVTVLVFSWKHWWNYTANKKKQRITSALEKMV